MKNRTIVAPRVESDFSKVDKVTYWKQILPQTKIEYTTKGGKRATLDFSEQYLTDLANAHKNKVLDQLPFLLADKDNAHTMDPERVRAQVTEVRLAQPGETPGLYGKFVFPSKEAAKAVIDNPNLGVSARIREGIQRSDGTAAPRAMIHVLGTLDPQVTGMAPWVPAVDLSFDPADNILDLSEYDKEPPVASKDDEGFPTEADIDAMTEAEVDAFLEKYAPGILSDAEVIPTKDEHENDEPQLVGAGAELSAEAKHDIELANAAATAANQRANEALRRMAASEWASFRLAAINDGVPPHLLDLAEPVLNRPDDMVIDLSNTGDEDVNASEIVRQFIEAAKGTIDLSVEKGHYGSIGSDEDPDKAGLAMWEAQF